LIQDQFHRVQEVFGRAATLAGDARVRFLDEACSEDVDLRREVDALLARDERAGGLREGVAAEAGEALSGGALQLPERIGPYEILGLVGRGGMGVVYRARQQNPERIVALKVLRPAMFSAQLLKRFELEKRVLARLQHPAIAQIFEAGTTDLGLGQQPWFAMELIEGERLSDWAADRSTTEKLELMVRICEAVHHAHQKSVIHRDLKPDNILVLADGRPKILDFGVARVTDSDLKLTTVVTDMQSLVGTLPYMSPEQASGSSEKLDIRSDVYALGVLTYELLAGRLPYDLREKSVAAAARVITDEDPRPLSTVDRVFRGDLETIVGKALEKEPDGRYASAAELGADIRRFLRDEPIQARPPSTIYQLKKFARRNKGLVAGLAATFVVLVAAVVGLSLLNVKATKAQDLAENRAQVASDVVAYLNRIMKLASPWSEMGGTAGKHDMTIIEAMDAALVTLDEGFFDDPLVEAKLRAMLGEVYSDVGAHTDEAHKELSRAIELMEEHGADVVDLYQAKRYLGLAIAEASHGKDQAPLVEYVLEVLEGANRDLPTNSRIRFDLTNDCAVFLQGMDRMEEAQALWRKSIPEALEAFGGHGYVYLAMRNSYASSLWHTGAHQEAFELMEEIVRLKLEARGEKHADTLHSRHELGKMYRGLGRLQESELLLRRVAADWEEIIGPQNGETLNAKKDLARTLLELDEPAEALELTKDVLPYAMEFDPTDPQVADSQLLHATALYANELYANELYDEAESACRDSLELQKRNEERFRCRLLLCQIKLARGEDDAGRRDLVELQREAGGTLPPDHAIVTEIDSVLSASAR